MMNKPIVIDTREPDEYANSHLEGAINIPAAVFLNGIPDQLVDLDKAQPIILYCRSGQRSNTVEMILRSYGFTNLTNGINEHHARKIVEHHATTD
jgi:phage shock protein E